jgi:hypothetical protein
MASQFLMGQSLKASFGHRTDELLKAFFRALFWSAFAESELEGFFCIGSDLVLIGAFSIVFVYGGGLRLLLGEPLKASLGRSTDELLNGFFHALFWSNLACVGRAKEECYYYYYYWQMQES